MNNERVVSVWLDGAVRQKMKGINGSGAYKHTGNTDGGIDYPCKGEYTLEVSKGR